MYLLLSNLNHFQINTCSDIQHYSLLTCTKWFFEIDKIIFISVNIVLCLFISICLNILICFYQPTLWFMIFPYVSTRILHRNVFPHITFHTCRHLMTTNHIRDHTALVHLPLPVKRMIGIGDPKNPLPYP